jgi:hypothetical protein
MIKSDSVDGGLATSRAMALTMVGTTAKYAGGGRGSGLRAARPELA